MATSYSSSNPQMSPTAIWDPTLESLALTISAQVYAITQELNFISLPRPSFSVTAPRSNDCWPASAHQARIKLIEAAQDLILLATGPEEYWMHTPVTLKHDNTLFHVLSHFCIPNHLPPSGIPITYHELSSLTTVPPALLRRFCRLAIANRIFRAPTEDTVAHTSISIELVRNPGLYAWIGHNAEEMAVGGTKIVEVVERWGDDVGARRCGMSLAIEGHVGESFFEMCDNDGVEDDKRQGEVGGVGKGELQEKEKMEGIEETTREIEKMTEGVEWKTEDIKEKTEGIEAKTERIKAMKQTNIGEGLNTPEMVVNEQNSELAVNKQTQEIEAPRANNGIMWDNKDRTKGWRARRFGNAMKVLMSGGPHRSSHVHAGFDWDSLGKATVVDIGGSTGHISLELALHHPNLTFIVQDLPTLLPTFTATIPPTLTSRIVFQPHDFFTPQPVPNASVYFLKHILHNWSDENCIAILRNIVSAMQPGNRIIIMDTLVPETGSVPSPVLKRVAGFDMQMLVACGTAERTASEWRDLVGRADERLVVKACRQPVGCAAGIIEVLLQGQGEAKGEERDTIPSITGQNNQTVDGASNPSLENQTLEHVAKDINSMTIESSLSQTTDEGANSTEAEAADRAMTDDEVAGSLETDKPAEKES